MVRYGRFSVLACGVTVVLGASGCEVQSCKSGDGTSAVCFQSLTRFEGAALEPEALPYSAGTSLSVHNIYGDIRVVEGTPGEARVKFEPFDYRAHDAEAAARRELADNFRYGFGASDSGIVAQTARTDSTNGLGADITLYLPPEFDGSLALIAHGDGPVNPGDVRADFVGQASSLDLVTMHLGDCRVKGAPSVTFTRAHCDGSIELSGIANGGTIATTGLEGAVSIALAAIGESGGGDITTEDGDITLSFPREAAFLVTALPTDDGSVDAPLLDAACTVDVSSKNSKSYRCGDADAAGPAAQFSLVAGTDGVGPSSISLAF